MQGQGWDWDGVRFELLQPGALHYQQGLKSNDLSCVLRVVNTAGRAVLLTGDIEAAQELALVQRLGAAALRSEVLLVPHHGSKTSSTEAFLAAVAPQKAFVQAGYRNRFGHPAPAVLARYQAQGVRVLNSPDCGAWRWRSADGQGACQRELRPRYWHARPRVQAGAEQFGPWPEPQPGF